MALFDFLRAKPKPEAAHPLPMPVVTPEALTVAHRIADHVRVQHPEARAVLLVAQVVSGAMQLERAEASQLEGPPPPASLFLDPELQVALLAADLGRLLEALGLPLREGFSVSVLVLRDRLEVLGMELPLEEARLRFGAALFGLLRDADAKIHRRQAALQQAMGGMGACDVSLDAGDGRLVFTPETGPARRVPATLLGSFAPDLQTWAWAWSHPSTTSAENLTLKERSALALFQAPELAVCAPLAFTVAYAGGQILGQRPVWRWPHPSGLQLFFAMPDEADWTQYCEPRPASTTAH